MVDSHNLDGSLNRGGQGRDLDRDYEEIKTIT